MKTKFRLLSLLLVAILLLFNYSCNPNDPNNPTSSATKINEDFDGNVYKTVKIGTQTWMAENLKTTHYRNGDLIGTCSLTKDITTEANPKYQWASGGNESKVAVFGRLYTWWAATDSRNIAPVGWHLPSSDEYAVLQSYLEENGYGWEECTNCTSKSLCSNEYWWFDHSYKWGVDMSGVPGYDLSSNNSSGFNAQPAGIRNSDGYFGPTDAIFWSSTRIPDVIFFNGDKVPYGISLHIREQMSFPAVTSGKPLSFGLSIRCIRD